MEDCEHLRYSAAPDGKTETCLDCGKTFDVAKPNPQQNSNVAVVDNTPYGKIEGALKAKGIVEKVTLALGHSSKDENGKQEALKYISSVLMEVQKSMGDDKKNLTVCSPQSIVQSMIDAASYRLPIDGRGLAYLVKYGTKASFQPGYKGLLYKIAEQFKDVDFTSEIVFENDVLELTDNGGFQSYRLTKANPFQNDIAKMQGVIACLTYSTDAGRHSKVVTLPKAEIDLIRGKAKQDYIWKEWFFEKAKAAALKRLCKIHMTTALGVQALAQFDNEEHFEASEQPSDITPQKPTEKLTAILNGASA